MSKKLYRSRENNIVCGLCGGIGDYFNVDPVLVRLLVVIVTLFGWGTGLLLYIVGAALVPIEPALGTGYGESGHAVDRDKKYDRGEARQSESSSNNAEVPNGGASKSNNKGVSLEKNEEIDAEEAFRRAAAEAARKAARGESKVGGASEEAEEETIRVYYEDGSESQERNGFGEEPGGGSGEAEEKDKSDKRNGKVIFGILLIAIGCFYILRWFVPWISSGLVGAAALIAIGVYIIVRGTGSHKG